MGIHLFLRLLFFEVYNFVLKRLFSYKSKTLLVKNVVAKIKTRLHENQVLIWNWSGNVVLWVQQAYNHNRLIMKVFFCLDKMSLSYLWQKSNLFNFRFDRQINQSTSIHAYVFYNKQIVQILSAEYAYSERERLTQFIFIKDFL